MRSCFLGVLTVVVVAVASNAAAAEVADPESGVELPDSEPMRVDRPLATPSGGPRATEPYPWSVGARGFWVPTLGIAGMGIGFDGTYSVFPELAFGAQHLRSVVDQFEHCSRCIHSGQTTLAFGELRFFPRSWITPYARLGAGLSHLRGERDGLGLEATDLENDLTVLGEIGAEFHYRWASLRVYGFDLGIVGSELDEDRFAGYGLQLGVRL